MTAQIYTISEIEFKFYLHEPTWLYIDNDFICVFDINSLQHIDYIDSIIPQYIKDLLGVDNLPKLYKDISTYNKYVYNSTHDVFWEYVFMKYDISFIGIIKKEFDIMILEAGVSEFTYDYRIARIDDANETIVYDKIRNNSFLGKIDKYVVISGNTYQIGLSYGT